MRILLLGASLVLSLLASAQVGPGQPVASGSIYESTRTHFSAEEMAVVRERLQDMSSIIGVHNHPVTESYIQAYTLRQRDKAEAILARIPVYFPLFEEELRKAGLPDDLKYLAVVESALDARARSRSGAGGLWQFMPGTAAMFGLAISRTLDERGDVEKSTKAAIEFLRQEYERFGDWALVLAAYNAGPGRVRRAKRRSGKNDFWEMRKFFPRETRNYVPAFVAAIYLHKYGALHGLRPSYMSYDEQLVEAVSCSFGVSLREVAQVTGLSLEQVRSMNRHCLADEVPPGSRARVRVPKRTAASMRTYLDWRASGTAPDLVAAVRQRAVVDSGLVDNNHLYRERSAALRRGASLPQLATTLGISSHHLELWNPMASSGAGYDQVLRYYEPKFVPTTPFDSAPKLKIARVDRRPARRLPSRAIRVPRHIDHRLPNAQVRLARYQSLAEVYAPLADRMTWEEFVDWNGLAQGKAPPAGTLLRVRQ